MNAEHPFQPSDLAELDELLSQAHAVVSMREIHAGNRNTDVIGMRHDVDNRNGAFDTALKMAAWEAERGYRSTYYLLHTAAYWQSEEFYYGVGELAALGHEIGIHANAIAHSLRTGLDPHDTLEAALGELRQGGLTYTVRGTVGHGDPLCHTSRFANAEQFTEYTRKDYGPPDRTLTFDGDQERDLEPRTLTLAPRPLASFGLDYESTLLGRVANTDSSGRWYHPWQDTLDRWAETQAAGQAESEGAGHKQLLLLVHPDWWGEAFA